LKHFLKTVFSIMLICCILAGFSGCSMFDFFAAENLLKPPKLTGEKAELQKAFENTVGTDISLFTPMAGEYRGSYLIFDANNDGNDEAVVFYAFNSNLSVVHMHLLSQNQGKWYSVGDYTGAGTDVYKVDFYNIDNTKNLEIGVIWSLDDSKKEKSLSLYRISSLEENSENSLLSLATIQIADYVSCDVDGDYSNELLYFYFTSDDGNSSSYARLLDYDAQNENLVPISEVKLPFAFTSIAQILSDKEDDNYRFYVDCAASGENAFSEIIVYNKKSGALYIPQVRDKYISSLSVRTAEVYCEDFNKDGYLDIPLTLECDDSYAVSDTDGTQIPLSFTEWYTYLDGEFMSLGKYFLNHYDGFALKLDALYEYYYVVYDYVNKVTQVRLKNSDSENNIVFSVSCINPDDDIVSLLPDGLLGDKNKTEYRIVISAKGETLSFTEAYIESLISDL